MPDFDVRAVVEVGDGAGHLQDAVVGRTLLADVGREGYFDSTIYLPEKMSRFFTDIFTLLLSFRPSGTETTL